MSAAGPRTHSHAWRIGPFASSPPCDKRAGARRARLDAGSPGCGDAGGRKHRHRANSALLFVDRVAKRLRRLERWRPRRGDGDGLAGPGGCARCARGGCARRTSRTPRWPRSRRARWPRRWRRRRPRPGCRRSPASPTSRRRRARRAGSCSSSPPLELRSDSSVRRARDQHAVSGNVTQPGFAIRLPRLRVVVGRIRALSAACRCRASRIGRAQPQGRRTAVEVPSPATPPVPRVKPRAARPRTVARPRAWRTRA